MYIITLTKSLAIINTKKSIILLINTTKQNATVWTIETLILIFNILVLLFGIGVVIRSLNAKTNGQTENVIIQDKIAE